MPAYLKVRRFSLNKANTFQQINLDELEREFTARGTLCEVPHCNALAFWMIPTGVPAFLCASHEDSFKSSRSAGIAIETAIRYSWQVTMETIVNAAYVDADKIFVTVVTPLNTGVLLAPVYLPASVPL